MAKDKSTKDDFEDLDNFDDIDLDGEFDDLFKDDDNDVEVEPPKNKREAVTRGIKKTYSATKDNLKSTNVLKMANSAFESSLTKDGKDAYSELKGELSEFREEMNKTLSPLKSSTRGLAATLANKTSNTRFKRTNKLFSSLANKLSDDISSSSESVQETIDSFKQEMLDSLQNIDNNINISKESGEVGVVTNKYLDKQVRLTAVMKEQDRLYYNKSLELQWKMNYTLSEQLKLQRQSYESTTKLLDTIIHNTSLPEAVKIQNNEIAMQMFKQKVYGGLSETVYKKLVPLKNLRTNIIQGLSNKVYDWSYTLQDVQDAAETFGELGESGLTKEAMIGMQLAGAMRNFAVKGASKAIPGKYKKAASGNLQAFMYNPIAFLQSKQFKDTSGRGGKLKELYNNALGMLGQYGENKATSVKLSGKVGLTDAAIFDGRTHNTINTIIPGYLAKIHNEIHTIRTGKKYNEDNELRYDNISNKFISKAEARTNLRNTIKTEMIDSAKVRTDAMVKSIKDVLANVEVRNKNLIFRDLNRHLLKYVATKGTISPEALISNDFIALFHPKVQMEATMLFTEYIKILRSGGHTADYETFRSASNMIKAPTGLLNKNLMNNNADLLNELNLVSYDSTGDASMNMSGVIDLYSNGYDFDQSRYGRFRKRASDALTYNGGEFLTRDVKMPNVRMPHIGRPNIKLPKVSIPKGKQHNIDTNDIEVNTKRTNIFSRAKLKETPNIDSKERKAVKTKVDNILKEHLHPSEYKEAKKEIAATKVFEEKTREGMESKLEQGSRRSFLGKIIHMAYLAAYGSVKAINWIIKNTYKGMKAVGRGVYKGARTVGHEVSSGFSATKERLSHIDPTLGLKNDGYHMPGIGGLVGGGAGLGVLSGSGFGPGVGMALGLANLPALFNTYGRFWNSGLATKSRSLERQLYGKLIKGGLKLPGYMLKSTWNLGKTIVNSPFKIVDKLIGSPFTRGSRSKEREAYGRLFGLHRKKKIKDVQDKVHSNEPIEDEKTFRESLTEVLKEAGVKGKKEIDNIIDAEIVEETINGSSSLIDRIRDRISNLHIPSIRPKAKVYRNKIDRFFKDSKKYVSGKATRLNRFLHRDIDLPSGRKLIDKIMSGRKSTIDGLRNRFDSTKSNLLSKKDKILNRFKNSYAVLPISNKVVGEVTGGEKELSTDEMAKLTPADLFSIAVDKFSTVIRRFENIVEYGIGSEGGDNEVYFRDNKRRSLKRFDKNIKGIKQEYVDNRIGIGAAKKFFKNSWEKSKENKFGRVVTGVLSSPFTTYSSFAKWTGERAFKRQERRKQRLYRKHSREMKKTLMSQLQILLPPEFIRSAKNYLRWTKAFLFATEDESLSLLKYDSEKNSGAKTIYIVYRYILGHQEAKEELLQLWKFSKMGFKKLEIEDILNKLRNRVIEKTKEFEILKEKELGIKSNQKLNNKLDNTYKQITHKKDNEPIDVEVIDDKKLTSGKDVYSIYKIDKNRDLAIQAAELQAKAAIIQVKSASMFSNTIHAFAKANGLDMIERDNDYKERLRKEEEEKEKKAQKAIDGEILSEKDKKSPSSLLSKIKTLGKFALPMLVAGLAFRFKDTVSMLWKGVKFTAKALWKTAKVAVKTIKGIYHVVKPIAKGIWNIGKGIWAILKHVGLIGTYLLGKSAMRLGGAAFRAIKGTKTFGKLAGTATAAAGALAKSKVGVAAVKTAGVVKKSGIIGKIVGLLKSFTAPLMNKLGKKAGAKAVARLSAKIASRGVPVVGQALLVADAALVVKYMTVDGLSLKSAVCKAVLGFDLFNDNEPVLDENGNPIHPDDPDMKKKLKKKEKKIAVEHKENDKILDKTKTVTYDQGKSNYKLVEGEDPVSKEKYKQFMEALKSLDEQKRHVVLKLVVAGKEYKYGIIEHDEYYYLGGPECDQVYWRYTKEGEPELYKRRPSFWDSTPKLRTFNYFSHIMDIAKAEPDYLQEITGISKDKFNSTPGRKLIDAYLAYINRKILTIQDSVINKAKKEKKGMSGLLDLIVSLFTKGRDKVAGIYDAAKNKFIERARGGNRPKPTNNISGAYPQMTSNMSGMNFSNNNVPDSVFKPPRPSFDIKQKMIDPMLAKMDSLGWSDVEKALFLSQVHVETGGFSAFREKINPNRAERNYGLGTVSGTNLGNTQPGDGAKFIGRGPLQITGRWNYANLSKEMGINLLKNPDIVATDPEVGLGTAFAHWNWLKKYKKGFREAINSGNIEKVSKYINGGYNGMKARIQAFGQYAKLISAGKIKEIGTDLWNNTKELASNAADKAGELYNQGKDYITNTDTYKQVSDKASDVLNTITNSDTYKNISGGISNAYDKAKGYASDAGSYLSDKASAIGQGIKTSLAGASKAIKAGFLARKRANAKSLGKCGAYVYNALRDAGYKGFAKPESIGGARTYSAADAVNTIGNEGFTHIEDNGVYHPGDVMIYGRRGVNIPHGHIQIFDGRNWISDFVQRSKVPGTKYLRAGLIPSLWRDLGEQTESEISANKKDTENYEGGTDTGNEISKEQFAKMYPDNDKAKEAYYARAKKFGLEVSEHDDNKYAYSFNQDGIPIRTDYSNAVINGQHVSMQEHIAWHNRPITYSNWFDKSLSSKDGTLNKAFKATGNFLNDTKDKLSNGYDATKDKMSSGYNATKNYIDGINNNYIKPFNNEYIKPAIDSISNSPLFKTTYETNMGVYGPDGYHSTTTSNEDIKDVSSNIEKGNTLSEQQLGKLDQMVSLLSQIVGNDNNATQQSREATMASTRVQNTRVSSPNRINTPVGSTLGKANTSSTNTQLRPEPVITGRA